MQIKVFSANCASKKPFLCLICRGRTRRIGFDTKKKSEGLAQPQRGLFLLFSFFIVFFWSFRHGNNLKALIGVNSYLYFAKHQIPCLNQQNGPKISAIHKISLKTDESPRRFIRALFGVQFLHFPVNNGGLAGMDGWTRKLFYSSPM